jgi:hypothetical protein
LFNLPLAYEEELFNALSGRAVIGTPDMSIVTIELRLFLINAKSVSFITAPLTVNEVMSVYGLEPLVASMAAPRPPVVNVSIVIMGLLHELAAEGVGIKTTANVSAMKKIKRKDEFTQKSL